MTMSANPTARGSWWRGSRRCCGAAPAGGPRTPTSGGTASGSSADPLTLDPDRLRVAAQGRAIELTAVEFALLATLHQAPGRIFSRERLMDRIYRDHRVVSDRTIDSHVKKLRRELGGTAAGAGVDPLGLWGRLSL